MANSDPATGASAHRLTSFPSPPKPEAAMVKPGPVTGAASAAAAPGRGRAQAPVAAVPDEQRASDPAAVTGQSPAGSGESAGAPLPDRSGAVSGEERRAAQRKEWKTAQSAHNAAKRGGRTKQAPKAVGPGMIRRLPPEGGDVA
jgi:hypothetical protein